jgi:hypothetical protein
MFLHLSNKQQQAPGAIDPQQMQLLANSLAQAFSQLLAFQQPQPPAPAPVPIAPTVLPQLPSNVIRLPTFHVTVVECSDLKVKNRASPASVVFCISRMDAFFETCTQNYSSDTLELNALIGCFPPISQHSSGMKVIVFADLSVL